MVDKMPDPVIELIPGDEATAIKKSEAEFIFSFIRDNGIEATLETGLGYGRSSIYIMSATRKRHTAIDPFQDRYNSFGIKNIESAGLSDKFEHIEDYSHAALPRLVDRGARFDFVFIDVDHKFDGEFIDFYYSDLLLSEGGYILLHDTWMRSTRLLMQFIRKNRPDYSRVKTPCRNLALYRKTGLDLRNGMHFREFYTWRSLIRSTIIRWATGGRDTRVKKSIMRLRNQMKHR